MRRGTSRGRVGSGEEPFGLGQDVCRQPLPCRAGAPGEPQRAQLLGHRRSGVGPGHALSRAQAGKQGGKLRQRIVLRPGCGRGGEQIGLAGGDSVMARA